MKRQTRKNLEFIFATIRTIFQILAFILILLTFCRVSHANTKEEIENILVKNQYAIIIARRVMNEYPPDTQWFLVLNGHGYLTVIPMSSAMKKNYEEKFNRQFDRLKKEIKNENSTKKH